MSTDNKQQKVINQEISKPGLRCRINAMCASCIYDPYNGSGSWRKQTEECTSYNCPLFDVRPVSRASTKTPYNTIFQPRTGDCTNG